MKNGSPLGQAHARPTCLSRYSTSQGKHHEFVRNARLSYDADPSPSQIGFEICEHASEDDDGDDAYDDAGAGDADGVDDDADNDDGDEW